MFSIVCVTYNSESCLRPFLESVKRYSPEDVEIIIIDNSGKNYGLPFVVVNKEGSYPSGLNQGIAMCTNKNIVCCNPDIAVTKDWFYPLLWATRTGDIAGPITNFSSGIQGLGLSSQTIKVCVRFLIGFCFMITKPTYEEVGPFDEQFVYEQDDLDYSLRARRAGKDLFVTQAFVYHTGHSSAKTDPSAFNDKRWLSLYRMLKKYPDVNFPQELGSNWPKDWLIQVAKLYPDVSSLESYKICLSQVP